MRFPLMITTLVALSACSPTVPDSGAGVGFGDYNQYQKEQAARDAALAGNGLPSPTMVSTETLGGANPMQENHPHPHSSDSGQIAAETQAILAGGAQTNSGEAVVHASPSNPAPAAVLDPNGISNENDFEAVGSQRSIESDAARIAANKQQYQVAQTQALPARNSESSGPNVVDYALRNEHAVGTKIYTRVGIGLANKAQRNCAKYPSPDLAQTAFLEKGGPQRDRLGLDPDGDGYACSWDPSPFRNAVKG